MVAGGDLQPQTICAKNERICHSGLAQVSAAHARSGIVPVQPALGTHRNAKPWPSLRRGCQLRFSQKRGTDVNLLGRSGVASLRSLAPCCALQHGGANRRADVVGWSHFTPAVESREYSRGTYARSQAVIRPGCRAHWCSAVHGRACSRPGMRAAEVWHFVVRAGPARFSGVKRPGWHVDRGVRWRPYEIPRTAPGSSPRSCGMAGGNAA